MRYKQKQNLKITGLLPAIVSVIVFVLVSIIWGFPIGFYVLGSIILIYACLIFYEYYRTKHGWTLLSSIYMVSYSALLITLAPHIDPVNHQFYFPLESKILVATTLIIFYWLAYLNFKRKLKWRGREILELAAYNIDQTDGSFTERPRPTGKVDFSRRQLEDFAKFFQKKLLGLAYKEESRVVFMPLKYKNEFYALYNPNYNYLEKTWVAITNEGNVSVNISKKDYLDYKEDLAFDQLCSSLGDVVIEFISLYIQGKEVRIIDKMDDLRVNVFS